VLAATVDAVDAVDAVDGAVLPALVLAPPVVVAEDVDEVPAADVGAVVDLLDESDPQLAASNAAAATPAHATRRVRRAAIDLLSPTVSPWQSDIRERRGIPSAPPASPKGTRRHSCTTERLVSTIS
jgi:hypothetical protein